MGLPPPLHPCTSLQRHCCRTQTCFYFYNSILQETKHNDEYLLWLSPPSEHKLGIIRLQTGLRAEMLPGARRAKAEGPQTPRGSSKVLWLPKLGFGQNNNSDNRWIKKKQKKAAALTFHGCICVPADKTDACAPGIPHKCTTPIHEGQDCRSTLSSRLTYEKQGERNMDFSQQSSATTERDLSHMMTYSGTGT